MSEREAPQLSLGPPPGKLAAAAGRSGRALAVLCLLQVATLAGVIVVAWRRAEPAAQAPKGDRHVEDLRAVAIELENKSLAGPAAAEWEQYLAAAPAADDRVEILYRIGKLHMQAGQYGSAAAAFVQTERAAGDKPEWKQRIGPQLVTCLRRLGLYGEVGRELSRRVEAGAKDVKQGAVLATLAGESLTAADLDRLVERRVDQMLTMQGAQGDAAARQELLKQLSAPQVREQMLQDLLQRELCIRRARELKLDQDADFQDARQMLEEDLLARRFQERELADIKPTEVDLASFHKAHPELYREPESAEATFVPLRADEDPAAVLKDVKAADDFAKLAEQRAKAENRPPEACRRQPLRRGAPHPQLGDATPLFAIEAGKWTDKPHVNAGSRYLVLIENKRPERTLPLEEVRRRVEADYRARKVQELSQKLFHDLMTRYDVRLEKPKQEQKE